MFEIIIYILLILSLIYGFYFLIMASGVFRKKKLLIGTDMILKLLLRILNILLYVLLMVLKLPLMKMLLLMMNKLLTLKVLLSKERDGPLVLFSA